ncbi:BTAD domain-containing putative transcriptional regulator [Streptomyces sp. NBRC 110028]|uniref:BTAD domain-containing putative transcriptional regulator n=1 Tax=Streptomyces sp. NBRC 110028 TaxID=1621260 RepID=UPI0006E397EF|nr:BTAD domain-containing putative transcriptional regulator [Streptomyces sp. NBRC 110028]
MTRRREGRETPLGPPRHQALLGLLLIRLGQVVPTDQLAEELWSGAPPRRPAATLQTYVSHLRRSLAPDSGAEGARLLRFQSPGYVLALDPEYVDAHRFESLIAQARRYAGEHLLRPAHDLLTAALGLWRGSPFLGLTSYEPLAEESSRLEQQRLTAVESYAEVCLALGQPDAVVARLGPEARRHPMRERLIGHLMTALYELGRQAEALQLYERTRACLAEELGVDADAELQRVHTRILRHELTVPSHYSGAEAGPPVVHLGHPVGHLGHPVGHLGHPVGHLGGDDSSRNSLRDGSERRSPAPPDEVPTAARPGEAPSFVGRERELAALLRLTDDALQGAGHLMAVVGDMGVGKTRLIAELVARLGEMGQEVICAQSDPGEGVPAHWMWSQILRQLALSRRKSFREATASYAESPNLALLEPPSGPQPSRTRFLLQDAVCVTLTALAAERPLVLVLENLHLSDGPSLDLLRLLRARLYGSRLSVLVTISDAYGREEPVRGEDLSGKLSDILSDPGTRTMRLQGLSEQATEDLIAAQVGTGVDTQVVRALHRRTQGNPYLLLQLLSMLGTTKSLHDHDAVSALLTEVPPDLHTRLSRRLAALPARTRRVLEVCAVLGAEVDLDVVKAVLDDGEDFAAAVDSAVRGHLLTADAKRPGVFSFTSVFVRETLLGELAPDDRDRLHARAARLG